MTKCHFCEEEIQGIDFQEITPQPVIYVCGEMVKFFCNDTHLYRWLKEGHND